MRLLVELFLKQSRAVYIVLVLIVAAGAMAFRHLPMDVYPELSFPRIAVIASVGDMSPERVLLTATRTLEQAAGQVYKVRWIRSKTIRGATELSVEFHPGADMVFAWQQLEARLAELRAHLPVGTNLIVEPVTPAIFPVLNYNVSSNTVSPGELYNIMRYQVEPRLTQVPGVARVITQSGKIPEISVQVDPEKLRAYKVSMTDVANALSATNQVQVLGRVDDLYQQNLIVGPGESKTAFDLAKVVVIKSAAGEPVFLKDIGTITDGYQDPLQVMSVDGREGVVLNIFRQPNSNVVAVSNEVAATLDELKKTLPPGIRISPAYDASSLVKMATKSMLHEITEGVILVIVILFAFLRSWRCTLIAALTIPLCAAATFGLMYLLGQSLNLMSLGGLAIALGLVIDDAIVIVEGIHRQMEGGLLPRAASLKAVSELAAPVISSTATTLVVFIPLGLLSGVAGQFFTALTVTLTGAVGFSLVLALFVMPVMSAQFLKSENRKGPTTEQEQSTPEPRSTGNAPYAKALRAVLRLPLVAVLLAVLVLTGTVLLSSKIGSDFLPEVDEGSYVLDYFMPAGTSLPQTDAVCKKIEKILGSTPEVATWTRRTGAELGLFATEPNTGDMLIVLKPHAQRQRTSAEVMEEQRQRIRDTIPELEEVEFHPILNDQLNDLSGAGNPIEVRVFGEDPDAIRKVAEEIEKRIKPIKGVVDVGIPSQEGAPEVDVRVDSYRAGRIGLSPQDVNDQVKASLLGKVATQLKQGDRLVDVRVRLQDRIRLDPANLSNIPLFSKSGAMLPLSALAEIRKVRGEREIHRENQQRYVSVEASAEGRDLGSVIAEIREKLSGLKPPLGVLVSIAGIYLTQQETFNQLLLVLSLATVLVYLMMVLQFKSLLQPLVILAVLPLGLFGVELALVLTKTPLNVSSFMGVILLVGLVVKNGIIMLEYSNRLRASGMGDFEALVEASAVRLRPILMTTLCTLLALIPLAAAGGVGSEMHRPLAITVIGGLSFSTLLTLFFVPLLQNSLDFATRSRERGTGSPVGPEKQVVGDLDNF